MTSHSYEVVIADSSNDNTFQIIVEKFPNAKLIKLPERTPPGPARNAAVQNSKGEVLAFLDADCTIPPDWIENIARTHEAGNQVVGGAVLNGTPYSYIGTAEHISEFSEYSCWQRARELRMIPTCNLSIRRPIFDAAGNFETVDTGHNLFKSEDLLLCHRIAELGYAIRFDPKIRVHHHNRMALGLFLRNQLSLGFSSAVVRKLVTIQGSILVKHISLSFLIPVVKTGILFKRMATYNLAEFLNLLFHMPLIFLGSFFYAIGFRRGVKTAIIFSTPEGE